jgi:hypothetical protein
VITSSAKTRRTDDIEEDLLVKVAIDYIFHIDEAGSIQGANRLYENRTDCRQDLSLRRARTPLRMRDGVLTERISL